MIAATDEERRIIVMSGGNPVAISLYVNAGNNNKQLLFTYTKAGVGEKQIFVEDDATGKLLIIINRAWDKEYKGKLFLQFDYQEEIMGMYHQY